MVQVILKTGKGYAVRLYRGPESRRLWVGGFRTAREARAWEAAHAPGPVLAGPEYRRVSLEAWLGQWQASRQVSHREAASCRSRLARYVVPYVGHLDLARVGSQALEACLARAPEGVRPKLWKDLRQALQAAVRAGILARNPMEQVPRPAERDYQPVVWTDEEADRFLAVARRHPLGLVFELALATGMRQGEVLGLTWRDVDLEAGVVHVTHDLERLPGGGWRLGPVKTRSGRRSVLLTPDLVRRLRAHRAAQAAQRLATPGWESDLVFTAPRGEPLWGHHLTERVLPRLCEEAGVPRVRFHDLRHAHATQLLRRGVHPKVVQARLGHSRAAFTLDRYSWATADLQGQAVEALTRSTRSMP